jgi:hypothetical protein
VAATRLAISVLPALTPGQPAGQVYASREAMVSCQADEMNWVGQYDGTQDYGTYW